MGMKKKVTITLGLLTLYCSAAFSQTDFKQVYFNGKNLFRDGKYALAMETFKKAIPYDQSNPFSEYASFYYAISAYRQGFLSVAKDGLVQIKTLYPKWDKMEDVNFWLGRIYLDKKDYFQALKIWSDIRDPKIQSSILVLKQQALVKIEDKETLRMLYEEHPADEVIAGLLAKSLSTDLTNTEDRKLLESIISKFKFPSTDFIPEMPKTFYKDKYAVSVLFPFMVNSLEPSPGKKRNQIILDIYEGMKLALDTLSKLGVNVSLRPYDTERNPEKIKKILQTPELQSSDLIVGPIYPEENKVVQDFSSANHINVFSPTSNNSEIIGSNPYSFLFQPSFETIGKKSSEYLYKHARKKNCIVFYGSARRDSVLAANFVQKAKENKFNIVLVEPVTKEESAKIVTMLATPTEFDEFKYPSEFSLKKDSIGSIFVASDEALIYTKVISSVETRGDSILVLGSENWLDQATYEKYERLGIVMASPNFSNSASKNYKTFFHKFIRTHGQLPSNFSKLGYEFMMFAGLQLKKNGVYFQDNLSKETKVPGVLYEGYNFQSSHDNQLVPFVKFKRGELKVVDKL